MPVLSQTQSVKNNTLRWWSFDDVSANKTIENISNLPDSIEGNYKMHPYRKVFF